MPGATVMYAAGGHDCREQVRPLFTGIARVEKLAWAMQEEGAMHGSIAEESAVARLSGSE